MGQAVQALIVGAAIFCAPAFAMASSSDATAAQAGERAEGRPHDYESPVCREARARAESAAQVPGFESRLEEIISVVPECFVGWEPEGS